MSLFDTFAVVDWSAGNDTGPTPRKDAIWLGLVRQGQARPPEYLRNRELAFDRLGALIDEETRAGRRLMIGFDFPFAYPEGFAKALTGETSPFAVWRVMAEQLVDTARANTRFELAGRLNARFPGIGPFWFNGGKADIPHLPRRKSDRTDGHGQKERRDCETRAPGTFTCWQMGGAGAVGGQVMTGMAVLARLRAAHPGKIAVWPFEPLDRPVVFTEIWPSLIADAVREAGDEIKDRAQVRLLSWALSQLGTGDLARMLDVAAPVEGWILGLGHEAALDRAARAAPAPPRLRDDCFAMPAGVDWMPVALALSQMRDGLHPVVGEETVPLSGAAGRVLAQAVSSRRAHPQQANSAIDGYGYCHAAVGSGPVRLPLVDGRAAAGVPYTDALPPGSALRILTGAALPEGVDTVVLEEDCTVAPSHVAFRADLKPGANTRPAGEDFAAQAPLLDAGHRLRAPDLALLAAGGHGSVPVRRRLRVAILSTGDELVEPGDPAPGTVDANRPMLRAMLEAWGHEVVDLGCAGDDRDTIRAALSQGATTADAIVTSGGASAGDEDHVSALLRSEGQLTAWRIALKPGRPLALAMWRERPVFGLPGNPVAAMVCALIFARPALSILAGAGWSEPLRVRVPAAFAKRKKAGRSEYLRARLNGDGAAEVFASEGSGRISGLSWAEGLVELSPEARDIAPGDPVTFLPYAGFGV